VVDPTASDSSGNTSDFKLRITMPGDTLLGDEIRSTPYTSGVSFIFGATTTGTYRLRVDGGVDGGPGGPAYYDIRISATPVPAALPLFATGLGMLGLFARRRTRKAIAA
jgi:hypothetical protein